MSRSRNRWLKVECWSPTDDPYSCMSQSSSGGWVNVKQYTSLEREWRFLDIKLHRAAKIVATQKKMIAELSEGHDTMADALEKLTKTLDELLAEREELLATIQGLEDRLG